MRSTLLMAALLLMMAAAASSLPNACRGASCGSNSRSITRKSPAARTISKRPSPAATSTLSVEVARRPAPLADNSAPTADIPTQTRRTLPSRRKVPKRPFRPSTTPSTTTTTEADEDVTEAVTEEIREVGVNGWLAAPTEAPATPLQARTEPTPKPAKSGRCESPKGFGIKCMSRLDQCTYDSECPGATKCCMVGECGYLCVKPKPTSTDIKQPTKAIGVKSKGTEKATVRSIEKVDTENEPGEGETQEAPAQSREAVDEAVKEDDEGGQEEKRVNNDNKGNGESKGENVSTSTTSRSTSSPNTSDVTTEAEATLQSPALV